MNAKQFFDLTAKVRNAQKDYFAARKRRGYNAASKEELNALLAVSRNLESQARKRRGYNAASKEELNALLAVSRNLESQIDAEIERVNQIQREAMEPRLNFK